MHCSVCARGIIIIYTFTVSRCRSGGRYYDNVHCCLSSHPIVFCRLFNVLSSYYQSGLSVQKSCSRKTIHQDNDYRLFGRKHSNHWVFDCMQSYMRLCDLIVYVCVFACVYVSLYRFQVHTQRTLSTHTTNNWINIYDRSMYPLRMVLVVASHVHRDLPASMTSINQLLDWWACFC